MVKMVEMVRRRVVKMVRMVKMGRRRVPGPLWWSVRAWPEGGRGHAASRRTECQPQRGAVGIELNRFAGFGGSA